DSVIAAVGEKVDAELMAKYGIAEHKRGERRYGDVYVIGDASRGPATVAEAIADAKFAVENITDRAILASIPEEAYADKGAALIRKMKLMEKDKCEADRCISCNRVCECCVSVCPNRANVSIAVPGYEMCQILHVDYMCNECGNCAHFCPYTNGRPYKDKFTLFANEKDFEDSENSGFMVVCPACPKVKVRLNGEVKEYTLDGTSDLDRKLEDLMLTVIRDYSYLIG
ncbi:MAG: putative selenate reductase subunit YgfK, partial [Clostridia bacterium]|nr:putative selenate reductase subunit YgfK [Clostridia bacterium]